MNKKLAVKIVLVGAGAYALYLIYNKVTTNQWGLSILDNGWND